MNRKIYNEDVQAKENSGKGRKESTNKNNKTENLGE